jgi:hypothetical protein
MSTTLSEKTGRDEPETEVPGEDVFSNTVTRLSRQSVDKHFDAYADVDWDAEEMTISPEDTRFSLWSFDPLAATEWYRTQPPAIQSRLGLHRIAAAMRVGWEFENVLQRGLLLYAFWLPNGRPEFRYIHHENAEESQHTMMFQEVINRSGLDVKGMPRRMKVASHGVVVLSRLFPQLFFLFVLGGEDPVDHLQRSQLRSGESHPVIERIMRIHVTEEARHISFARQYLKRTVPELGFLRRHAMAMIAPLLFGTMARLMVFPPASLTRAYGMPRSTVRKALRSAESRKLLADSVSKPRKLCSDLGLMTAPARAAWKLMGVWSPES